MPEDEHVAAYLRSATNDDLDDQLAEVQAHCEAEGYELDEEHIYQDIGAGTTATREGYIDFLEAVSQGEADVALAVNGTRFGRSGTAIVALAKACYESDTRIEYTEDGPSLDEIFETLKARVESYEEMRTERNVE